MRFKYKKISPKIIRPIVPIILKYNDMSIRFEALLDSGADMCVFPAEIGELIGIEIKKGIESDLTGIVGKTEKIYYHPVAIEIGGNSTKVLAGFSYSNNINSFGLLGQRGIFSVYVIKFQYTKGIVDIVPDVRVN